MGIKNRSSGLTHGGAQKAYISVVDGTSPFTHIHRVGLYLNHPRCCFDGRN